MVRTVKSKTSRSLKPGEKPVLLPGATGAEPWEVWIMDAKGAGECIRTCATPLDHRFKREVTTLVLPVSEVICLPLWLNETDPKQFTGMIPLQLELRGLQPRGNVPAVFDWSVVTQEETRTLIMIGVLPGAMDTALHAEVYHTFDLSARYLSYPENAMTLWQEQDRLCVGITQGRNLVYFQSLGEGRITSRVLQDLNCIRATLEMQDVLKPLQQIVTWMEMFPSEISALEQAFHLPIKKADRPAPKAPTTNWKLVPFTVGAARKVREMRRLWIRGLMFVLALYLVIIVAVSAKLLMTSLKVDELTRWQSEHAQSLALVHETRATWKVLAPVVDEGSYPLELLLHAAELIPVDQLHMTRFETSDGHLLIKGESKNVSAAFQFLDRLKKDEHFHGYTWDMPQPHLLPNDLAQFQIEGKHAN